ncbi:MAG: nucleotidyltransferase family protein [Flavobacteriales bacterium]|jgi:predicted nucleotidyltransferase|nr:nucleotidyltransferase family protein [Flavobacteriales bacterium]
MKANTKKELLELLHLNSAEICSFGVVRLGLFGSFVRDTADTESDVDLLVEFQTESKTLKNLVGLSNFLQQLLQRKVEVITPQSLNPFIGRHIIKEVEYVSLAA